MKLLIKHFLLLYIILFFFNCNNEQQGIKLSFVKIGSFPSYPLGGGQAKENILVSIDIEPQIIDYSTRYIRGQKYHFMLQQILLGDTAPMAFPVYKDQLSYLVQAGYLLDLKPYLYLMPNYMSLVNKDYLDSFSMDEKIFALPDLVLPGDNNGDNTLGWAIRKDWLKALNLDLPKTLLDLETILKEFTYNDPDGNGLNDTIGLSIDRDCTIIWGAYGLPYVNKDSWLDINGKSKHITTLPQTKEILILLKRWYELGYINFDRFNTGGSKLLSSNTTGICTISIWSLNDARNQLIENGYTDPVQMIPAIEGPYGQKGFPLNYFPKKALALNSSMNESEILSMLKFLDWMVDTTDTGGFMKTTYGNEGDHYTINDDKTIINILDQNKQITDGYSNPIRFLHVRDRRWIPSGSLLDDIKILNNNGNILYNKTRSKTSKEILYFTDYMWPKLFVGIITGELDISEWDNYAEKFSEIFDDCSAYN